MFEALPIVQLHQLNPIKQDDALASKVGLLTRDMSAIDWSKSAFEIHNKIRGLYSWPGASTVLGGKTLKIHSAVLSDKKANNKIGEVVDSNGKLIIACGDGNCIELKTVQLEGKKRMEVSAFLNGYSVEKGTVLGQ